MLLNHPNSFCRGIFKLYAKSDTDSLPYSLGHFECRGHTVHTLTEQSLPPPLTSTVKSSLFTHVHSSPLSLAVRLHRRRANSSCYINNDWTFSWQTLYNLIRMLKTLAIVRRIDWNGVGDVTAGDQVGVDCSGPDRRRWRWREWTNLRNQ